MSFCEFLIKTNNENTEESVRDNQNANSLKQGSS